MEQRARHGFSLSIECGGAVPCAALNFGMGLSDQPFVHASAAVEAANNRMHIHVDVHP